MVGTTDDQQLQRIRDLKIEAIACMGAAGRHLDPAARDIRPRHIADALQWVSSAVDMLRQMASLVEQRLADDHERELKRRREDLTQRDPLGEMAVADRSDDR